MTQDGPPGESPASDARTPETPGGGARVTGSAATQIEDKNRELSDLVNHLQSTAEAEKSALAKELHDELGGLITAAKMDMQWLSGKIGGSLDPASDEKFKSVVQMLNQAMMLKRRVVEELRPSLLDHFGLPVAIRSHFEEHCGKAGLECVTTLPEETLDLPVSTQLAVFRVAQEALSNVLARGNAKNIELVIDSDEGGYTMQIGDDGVAGDAAMSKALTAMRYRVENAGGTLEWETAPGQGNRIRVYVPRSPAKSG